MAESKHLHDLHETSAKSAAETGVTAFVELCANMVRERVEHVVQVVIANTMQALKDLRESYAEVQKLRLMQAVEADLGTQAARSSLLEIMQHDKSRSFYHQCKVLTTLYAMRETLQTVEKHTNADTWKKYLEERTKLQEVTPTFLNAKAGTSKDRLNPTPVCKIVIRSIMYKAIT